MTWAIHYAGESRDGRTNAWRVTPPCGHSPFTPQTTRFSTQHVECPKCGIQAVCNFNAQTIREWTEAEL